MYVTHCKLTRNEQLRLMEHFVAGTSARNHNHINGIPKKHFNLFLKECEWRFNIGSPKTLLDDLKIILKEYY